MAPDVKIKYRQVFYEALDLLVNGIKDRFNQPGYKVYSQLEQLLVKSAHGKDANTELDEVCARYGTDFVRRNLELQLSILNKSLPEKYKGLLGILKYLSSITPAQRSLMEEVCKLASLILVMPATNAPSERSFSSLRRIKTYLRSTMNQARLNSLMLLNAHLDRTDGLDFLEIGNAFVQGSEHRLSVFGNFVAADLQ